MIHLAKVALVARDSEPVQALLQKLREDSFHVLQFAEPAQALEGLEAAPPDVLLIGPEVAGDEARLETFVRQLGDDPALVNTALFVLTPGDLEACGDPLLALGVADAIHWPSPAGVVLQRLRPLVRVATMECELAFRTAQAQAMGVSMTVDADYHPDTAEGHPCILVVGPQRASRAMVDSGGIAPEMDVTQTPDLFEAQRLMEDQRFDACIMIAEDTVEPLLDLCSQIRRNPRLFNLPVIFVASAEILPERTRPLAFGASHVISCPPPPRQLHFALSAVVRRQRQRWAIRRDLLDTLDCRVVDPLVPEVYSPAFLTAYLQRRIDWAQQHQRQLSVAGFSFAGTAAIRHEFGQQAETHLLDQIGQWLTLLVRAEDLVARLEGACFVVVLPDTPLSEAQVVMNRIAGVISNTDFAVHDVYRVVRVWPYVQGTSLLADDTLDSLLTRAKALVNDDETLMAQDFL